MVLIDHIVTVAEAAVVYPVGQLPPGTVGLSLDATLTYGSGGTSLKAWVQTSLDGGLTYFDIACFAYTTATKRRICTLRGDTAVTTLATPGAAALADDTVVNGFVGAHVRVVLTSVGTYAGQTRLTIYAVPKG